jgi:hypothetical protein
MPQPGTSPSDRVPSFRELLSLFFPLALSGVFYPIARPFVNAALARTDDPALSLAAYSVTLSVTMPLVSPLFGMRQIVTALCVDDDMVRRVGRVALALGAVATVPLLALSIPAVYLGATDRILGIPADIARLGPPAMLLMATSPLLVIGRGYYQGVLVRFGNANPVGLGALGYLVLSAAVVFVAVLGLRLPGAVAGAVALLAGNLAYLLIVWYPTRAMRSGPRATIPAHDETFEPSKRSRRYILTLYYPLAVSTLLTAGVEPVVQAAMARAPDAALSLAAYPVCFAIVWLARTHLWNLQQVVIAKVVDRSSYRVVRRFTILLGLATTLMMMIALIPVVRDWLFGDLIGLQGDIREYAWRGYMLLIPACMLQAWRSLYFGTLVASGVTGSIQTAAFVRVGALLAGLGLGVAHGGIAGIYVGVGAVMLSEVFEVASLHLSVRRALARFG